MIPLGKRRAAKLYVAATAVTYVSIVCSVGFGLAPASILAAFSVASDCLQGLSNCYERMRRRVEASACARAKRDHDSF